MATLAAAEFSASRLAPRETGQHVTTLIGEHCALWQSTPDRLPRLGPHHSRLTQFANGRAARRLLDALAAEASHRPASAAERREWRERIGGGLERFGRERLGWSAGFSRLLLDQGFLESSADFVRQARACWPAMSLVQLGQALRNVWIGNWLQLLRGRRVELRPGLFAYSMLYPLTDNLLDDETVGADAKRSFGLRFGARLEGRPVLPRDRHEAAVFGLVGTIEREFPRRRHPLVHERLLDIHAAQSQSLLQQQGERLDDGELLALTVAKGGASVLADLHLVIGSPSWEEERLAFGYGVFLQLLDDLQDVAADLAARHETVFSRAARRGSLDAVTGRLAAFIDRILDGGGLLRGPAFADRRDLVRRNSHALLVGSVAEQEHRFSWSFRRSLAAQWPLSLRSCRRLRRRAATRWERTTKALGSSALERLLEAACAD